jgi:hypothetical protein
MLQSAHYVVDVLRSRIWVIPWQKVSACPALRGSVVAGELSEDLDNELSEDLDNLPTRHVTCAHVEIAPGLCVRRLAASGPSGDDGRNN